MWLRTIADKPESRDPNALIVSRDVDHFSGRARKEFRVCKDWKEYIGLLLWSPFPHLYEFFPMDCCFVNFYADHDCKTSDSRGMSLDDFGWALFGLHSKHFGLSEDSLGKEINISESCIDTKMSFHVTVRRKMTVHEAKAHAQKINDECQDTRLVCDLAVYNTRNQQFRAIGSSKIGRRKNLRPWGASSQDHTEHIVRIPGYSADRLKESHAASGSMRRPIYICSSDKRSLGTTRGDDGKQLVSRIFRRLSSCGVDKALGSEFGINNFFPEQLQCECADDGSETYRFYIDGSQKRGGFVVCPFAKRVHRGNRLSVCMRRRGGTEIRCMDPECSLKSMTFHPMKDCTTERMTSMVTPNINKTSAIGHLTGE